MVSNMSSSARYPRPRTDGQLLADPEIMWLLELIAAGRIDRGWDGGGTGITDPYVLRVQEPIQTRMMYRLAFLELIDKPISGPPRIAPRGERLLQMARGELPRPLE
jgi:hypothetical protein